ncbi:hypothetical protein B566_EDAN010603 [Ephemera danica]|nr:hypothetical protein B566_EDAN010603 [Ephemera danica]
MSHRIIEKRRRDRMNNCLADLSRLIPAEYLKKGRGRVEKTEIIEMAIKHMTHLQKHATCSHVNNSGQDGCEDSQQQNAPQQQQQNGGIVVEHWRLGFQECLAETMHFLVEDEGCYANDPLCDRLNLLRPHRDSGSRGETSSSSSRGYYGGGPGSTSSGSDSGGNGNSSKENNPGPADWRRVDVEETPSPLPLASQQSHPTSLKTLPPPPPPPPTMNGILSEQEDSLMSIPSESGESSQLRDMLTGNSPRTSRGNHDQMDTGSLYKFKNNIKQRFTAEHHDEKRRRITGPSNDSLKLRESLESPPPASATSGLHQIKQRQSPSPTPHTANDPQSNPSSNCSINSCTQNYGVPVFALHTKGSFYIPLTIDNEMLAPYMGAFGDHSQVLHPVTISVNFCGVGTPVHVPPTQQQAAPMVPWKMEPPGLMPLPKWSVCDQA